MTLPTMMVLATVTLRWTNPSFQADDICGANLAAPVHLTQILIQYAYVGGDGVPRTLRMHPAAAGAADTMMVPDTPAATYFVVPVNAIGVSTCQPASRTVGVPDVGVPLQPRKRPAQPRWFDVMGRRIELPLRAGFYFGWRDTTVLH